jgi:hypothetical protein
MSANSLTVAFPWRAPLVATATRTQHMHPIGRLAGACIAQRLLSRKAVFDEWSKVSELSEKRGNQTLLIQPAGCFRLCY